MMAAMSDQIPNLAIDDVLVGFVVGVLCWFLVRYVIGGFYTVDQNERAVKTVFGRADAHRRRTTLDSEIAADLTETRAIATPTRRCGSSSPAGRTSNGRGSASTRSRSPRRR